MAIWTNWGQVRDIGEGAQEPSGKLFSVGQQFLKGHGLGDGAVIEEQVDPEARGEAQAISPGRVNPPAAHIRPVASPEPSDLPGLVRGKDGKPDSQMRQDVKSFQVNRGLRQPHSLGLAAKAVLKVPDPPQDLGVFIPPVGQWQNHVVVGLGQGRAVPGKMLLAFLVRRQDALVSFRGFLLHPGQEGGPKVEADLGIVVDDLHNRPSPSRTLEVRWVRSILS